MATTTTNFGWDIPQSTDLVKDGATAIAALGQDIDTALVDLKGGTTGQVLAKASGTDLDFSWVAQDDSNAIQNAIVDAKGDLIGATAADTPARLAVGTNGQVLTADSTAATGLAWATPASGGTTILIVQDQKAQDTHGGTSTQGVNTRTLNTVVANTISGASLSSNQITLPAGTYRISGGAPYYAGSEARAYLYNTTDSAITVSGSSEFNQTTIGATLRCYIDGRFTISGTKVFELRQVIRGASVATFGLGRAVNSSSAPTELYSTLTIEKE
jgi:hypothetical protein